MYEKDWTTIPHVMVIGLQTIQCDLAADFQIVRHFFAPIGFTSNTT
jgi:hypothetical protein